MRGGRENAGNPEFYPFSTLFSTPRKTIFKFLLKLNMLSTNAFNLDNFGLLY